MSSQLLDSDDQKRLNHELFPLPEDLKHEYPFDAHFFTTGRGHTLHYIDEGLNREERPCILLLHGNPTWSFYFRSIIRNLSQNFRVIALDHINCGLSQRLSPKVETTLSEHIENAHELIAFLQLKNISLILHDWGGAIGMGLAQKNPEKIKSIIAMNTAAFLSRDIPWQINMLKNSVGLFLIKKYNLFAYPALFMASQKGLKPLVKKGMIYPYLKEKNRAQTAHFVLDIPLKKEHQSFEKLQKIEISLQHFAQSEIPIKLIWGKKDFCFSMKFYQKWLSFFPNAETFVLDNAGHYLIEDETEIVNREIECFLNKHFLKQD